ncbi:glycoside hydrolase family 26 protein [Chitinophaga sp.]|uniref:glycoside hydrolase family 26 protein n=1 Tax=Chitinophaga sp. TaxID=1869181 RepID=UPI002D0482EF|nr:glycosyl hydrolase [Chitinophaga sp.]HWV65261.1 glycosyl hydrolase [Chitinophaga sp.]
MKKILFFISSLLLAIGCTNKPDITPAGNMKSQSGNISGTQRIMGALLADHPADINATVETKNLYLNMKRLSLKGVMFGHEDDLATGVGWTNTPGRSDVKETAGQYPAVVGWDLGKLEVGSPYTLTHIDFDNERDYIKQVYAMGGINTLSWHLNNPVDTTQSVKGTLVDSTIQKLFANPAYVSRYQRWMDTIAEYISSLTGVNGEPIPIVLRLFHEMNGSWFWWGRDHCTAAEYIHLWQFTVDYLRNTKGLHNLLFEYGPDKFYSQAEYLERYPGDDYVDILAYDTYDKIENHPGNTFVSLNAPMIVSLRTMAMQRNKLWAIAETGIPLVPVSDWWTQTLYPIINNTGLSYALTWGNNTVSQYWCTYAGQGSAADMLVFFGKPGMFFQDKVATENMYTAREQLFDQDFDSSAVVADYVDSDPGNTHFTSIGSTGAGTVAAINSGKLRFDRTGGADNGYFSRTKDFAPVPAVIQYRFDLTVSGNNTGVTQQKVATFQVGSGFTKVNNAVSGTPVENNAIVYSRFGIDFSPTPGEFSIRDIGAAVTSPRFSGTQTITWVVNHSTQKIYYKAPDGTAVELIANKADLWVGTTRVFATMAPVTATPLITDLKFAFTGGNGIIDIDNIMISDYPG